ncbi:hypothetical protein Q2356_25110, partial [Escherichia coli]|nr:hypothetical protein [Escherichia coli]
VELVETVVTVIPTPGAIRRATFNAQIGEKVFNTQQNRQKNVPFGALVQHVAQKKVTLLAVHHPVYPDSYIQLTQPTYHRGFF